MTFDSPNKSPIDNSTLNLLLSRRSVTAKDLCEPGPNPNELEHILRAAHRVPDHKKLGPWRFIVFQGEARKAAGELLASVLLAENPDATPQMIEFEKIRFLQAPVVIAVVSNPIPNEKAPEWEQILSTGAACQNILLGAHSMGYSAQWLTEWYSYSKEIHKTFGLSPLEKFAGFIYIGSASKAPSERERPSLEDRVSFWHS